MRIILEKCYSPEGKYLGMISIDDKDLTPDVLDSIRADTEDSQGWKKYRKVMKEHGHNIGEIEA